MEVEPGRMEDHESLKNQTKGELHFHVSSREGRASRLRVFPTAHVSGAIGRSDLVCETSDAPLMDTMKGQEYTFLTGLLSKGLNATCIQSYPNIVILAPFAWEMCPF